MTLRVPSYNTSNESQGLAVEGNALSSLVPKFNNLLGIELAVLGVLSI